MSSERKRVRREPKHTFRFKAGNTMLPYPTKTKKAKTTVKIVLEPDHVRKSIELHGVGNTQNCSAAICVKSHAQAFPHPVNDIVDWTFSRVYVVSKWGKDNMPLECTVYRHNGDWVAKLNDSPGGQKKLLRILEKEGPKTLLLSPLRRRLNQPKGRPKGVDSGKRTARPHNVIGAALRYAFAHAALGGAEPL